MLEITDEEYERISRYVHKNYGIKLGSGKVSLVLSRLTNTVLRHGFDNFSDYYDFVVSDPSGNAVYDLINRITTNHTYFMREWVHFDFFKQTVLPELSRNNIDQNLRIWSAGCSTGQEAYTLALLIHEFLGFQRNRWQADVLATDISTRALTQAKAGRYSEEELQRLPAAWKNNYMKRTPDGQFEFLDDIKQAITVRKFNLMEPRFPFKRKFHVIFCRNVMIYFDQATIQALVEKFDAYLEVGGYLFIGLSEFINTQNLGLRAIAPSVYRKEGVHAADKGFGR